MHSQTNYEEYKQILTSTLECKSVSPVVYFESYFENFKSRTSVEEIANQILDVLRSSPTDIIEKETRHHLKYPIKNANIIIQKESTHSKVDAPE